MCWFQKSRPNVPCEHRQRVAREILAKDPADLEANALKVRNLCPHDLQQAKETGTCGLKLYSISKTIAYKAIANIEELEGLNNLIKLQGTRAPNISLELLDARMCTKKRLGSEANLERASLQTLLPIAGAVQKECLSHACELEPSPEELGYLQGQRWTPPQGDPRTLPPTKLVDEAYRQADPSRRITTPMLWATGYNLKLSRACKRIDARQALVVNHGPSAFSAYVCVEKLGNSVKMVVMCNENANTIVLKRPARFVSSLNVFAAFYNIVHGENGCEPRVTLRNILWHKHSELTAPARFPKRLQLAVGEEYETFLFKLERKKANAKTTSNPRGCNTIIIQHQIMADQILIQF